MADLSPLIFKDWIAHRYQVVLSVAKMFEEREDLIEAAYHRGLAMGLAQALKEYNRRRPDQRTS